jgi:hypothetical protein
MGIDLIFPAAAAVPDVKISSTAVWWHTVAIGAAATGNPSS